MFNRKNDLTRIKNSICTRCNSGTYCANATSGVTGCENFNKFPKEPKCSSRNG